MIDNKATIHEAYRVLPKTLDKLSTDALRQGMLPMLHIEVAANSTWSQEVFVIEQMYFEMLCENIIVENNTAIELTKSTKTFNITRELIKSAGNEVKPHSWRVKLLNHTIVILNKQHFKTLLESNND